MAWLFRLMLLILVGFGSVDCSAFAAPAPSAAAPQISMVPPPAGDDCCLDCCAAMAGCHGCAVIIPARYALADRPVRLAHFAMPAQHMDAWSAEPGDRPPRLSQISPS